MPKARFDLHLHTEYSPDCDTAIDAIEPHCLKQGLTGLAVTDHDTIEGALRLRDRAKTLRVIVGQEVTTRDGDIVGLFLNERVPPRTPALEAISAIHAQGGIAYLPHPFDKRKARQSGGASLSGIIKDVDIVEAFNGKVGRERYNTLAAEYAQKHHKTVGGGSDAHDLRAIGTVYNEWDEAVPFATPQEFLARMQTAHIVGTRRSPLHGVWIIGRRPFSLALRRLRQKQKNGT